MESLLGLIDLGWQFDEESSVSAVDGCGRSLNLVDGFGWSLNPEDGCGKSANIADDCGRSVIIAGEPAGLVNLFDGAGRSVILVKLWGGRSGIVVDGLAHTDLEPP